MARLLPHSRLTRIGISFLTLLSALLLVAGGCVKSSVPKSPPVHPVAAEFVSETECAACHGDLSRKFADTHHARALHIADTKGLGALAPPSGEIEGTPYRLIVEGEKLYFADREDPTKRRLLDFALGSGKLAMTYVSLQESKTLTELRLSWYPDKKRWYITPGQENMRDQALGFEHDAEDSKRCFTCHAVTVPADSLRPEEKFFGVGCQSCHGPASAHVAAAKAGETDPHIERIGTWDATRINQMCGKCHRSLNKVGTADNEVTMTQRFQAFGLMQSACFQKSGKNLSCITCHDSHDNVSTDAKTYEKACLNCHASKPSSSASTQQAVHGKPCRVNPQEKCVECHMPKRKVFARSQLPISMADHLIWIYKK